jgi:hypothetical protein
LSKSEKFENKGTISVKLKEKYAIENFLKLDIVRSDVSNFIRIRISNSTLMIEKGRHRKINLANIICPLCRFD